MPSRLSESSITERCAALGTLWSLNEEGHLIALYKFSNFQQALDFANAVGARAESADHHPDLLIGWGRCAIELWTHDAGGLTEKDFDLARQIADIYDALP